ncbi:pilus assembly protein [Rhodobacteraceae bacterium KMM 6894]|nr:pilus assembly protein [Rhodobacteraceae bacterium KMM 6894]
MTFLRPIKSWLHSFRNDEGGSITVEAAITLPLLFWAIAASYEFFEVHRYNSSRDKATYTIADIISRELQSVTPTYMDSAKTVFDTISNDEGQNSVRVTIVKYDLEENEYSVKWSQVRGTSDLVPMVTDDVRTAYDTLPNMADGEELIIVDSSSHYPPLFNVGMNDDINVTTRVVTSPRFAPQINWENS